MPSALPSLEGKARCGVAHAPLAWAAPLLHPLTQALHRHGRGRERLPPLHFPLRMLWASSASEYEVEARGFSSLREDNGFNLPLEALTAHLLPFHPLTEVTGEWPGRRRTAR